MPKPTKRKSDSIADDDAEPANVKRPKPGRKSLQNAVLQDEEPDTDAEDVGHAATQRFLVSTKQPAKGNHAISRAVVEFEKLLEEQEQESRRLIDEKAQSILDKDIRLRQIVLATLSQSLRSDATEATTTDGHSRQPLSPGQPNRTYRNTMSIIESSKGLLNRYDYIDQQITSVKVGPSLTEYTEDDVRILHSLLGKKARLAEREIYTCMHGEGPRGKEKEEELSTEEKEVWNRFAVDKSEGMIKGRLTTWADAAGHVKRDVRKLMRHVAEEQE